MLGVRLIVSDLLNPRRFGIACPAKLYLSAVVLLALFILGEVGMKAERSWGGRGGRWVLPMCNLQSTSEVEEIIIEGLEF